MLFAFLQTGLGRIVGWAALALVAVGLFWGGYRLLTASPRTEARLARNQAEAASQSGSDAVNTVGAAGEREAAGDALTRSNEAEIRAAPGASAAVSTEARAAGLAALCKRAAYRGDPRCAKQ